MYEGYWVIVPRFWLEYSQTSLYDPVVGKQWDVWVRFLDPSWIARERSHKGLQKKT